MIHRIARGVARANEISRLSRETIKLAVISYARASNDNNEERSCFFPFIYIFANQTAGSGASSFPLSESPHCYFTFNPPGKLNGTNATAQMQTLDF
jgi:hypothetical protein